MALYLVTGVAGFIGSSIAKALVARGDRVRGIDNFSTGKRQNLVGLDQIDFVEGDIVNAADCLIACAGVDYVFHQAAIPSVPRSVKDPVESNLNNVTGTLNILVAARDAGVKRVVYAGSSAVYGDAPMLPKREDMTPDPISPYAVAKIAGEHYLSSFARCYGMETVSLRYFNVFGPQQDATSMYSGVLAQFITKMLNNERPTILGDGEQSRDFTFIANVVEANLLACAVPAENVSGGVFNIATGSRISLNETFCLLKDLTRFEGEPLYGPGREGDIKHSLADISLARQQFGYEPTVDFRDGVSRTVAWYRTQGSSAQPAIESYTQNTKRPGQVR
jgi:nucleoside-diphosphate-sugar epimerase